MQDHALSVSGLTKTYPGGFQALQGVDFHVRAGEFCALLGPNGAGKSTTINIITTLLPASAGEVKIFGHDIRTQASEAKRLVGLVPQEFNFNMFEKIIDILLVQAAYYGIKRSQAKKNAEMYLKKLGLWQKRHQRARTLSGGMKRRLMIVRALIHHPKLLILDEPTAGVDIELRRSMWQFLKDINEKEKITIILTTHYLEEAEKLCKQIIIINQGKIIRNTDKKNLLQSLDVEYFIVVLSKPLNVAPELQGYITDVDHDGNLEIGVKVGQNLNRAFEQLSDLGVEVMSLSNKHNRLEELFLQYTATAEEE
ncbi:Daunorubicin/doxorubicin resistance ATP-binding protein DrrA [Piscirickettsia salmonis]|uniref:ABC transporter ATP-binding protein n=1 Tax=Piscirickettsia salmonis TaxID=1238 RepID=UPI0012B8CD9C|nr:ABC transporter ATP-binding protein [Piscirickettsia salmonis]QGP49725.1 Daunorubicin/doxorubicin resistance ATP-binding protein DrrA [Piscirickettsia salmonis]QGP55249.1 Daunorubicin/doxorubicin resistance ATP-binding protein DrrA [Piscirickettsia salmonis]QGP58894.1 Daunorubicin/doxorubicin resistance ATP-binding protein DrrA [Piscirickettsia salmonis]QGP64815.1 Daunorubicin/doxorubicin resistance ATP-binding protein DrrA [Piscirickettsia salmonis]